MSNLTVRGNVSGTGTVILESPNTNTNRTLTLPDATTTLVGTDAAQTLTNKTLQGGALTQGTAVASTSGTSIDFPGIPSWAKRITVLFRRVSASGASNFLVRVGSGSFQTTGYISNVTAARSAATSAATGNETSGLIVMNDGVATYFYTGSVVIANLTGNDWISSGLLGEDNGNRFNMSSGHVLVSGGVLDRIRVTTVNGTDTFDAGSINVMYEG